MRRGGPFIDEPTGWVLSTVALALAAALLPPDTVPPIRYAGLVFSAALLALSVSQIVASRRRSRIRGALVRELRELLARGRLEVARHASGEIGSVASKMKAAEEAMTSFDRDGATLLRARFGEEHATGFLESQRVAVYITGTGRAGIAQTILARVDWLERLLDRLLRGVEEWPDERAIETQ